MVKGTYPVGLLDVKSVDFHNKDLAWECATAYWKPINGNGTGHVTFSFSLSLLGSSFYYHSIDEIVTDT